jgi:platelet-activating factor acetylhydrolase IB subunit alpha
MLRGDIPEDQEETDKQDPNESV